MALLQILPLLLQASITDECQSQHIRRGKFLLRAAVVRLGIYIKEEKKDLKIN